MLDLCLMIPSLRCRDVSWLRWKNRQTMSCCCCHFSMSGFGDKPVPVFATPGDPASMTPVKTLSPQTSWVSIDNEVNPTVALVYRIDDEEYVLASDALSSPPSLFQGSVIEEQPQHPIGYAIAPGAERGLAPAPGSDNAPVAQPNATTLWTSLYGLRR